MNRSTRRSTHRAGVYCLWGGTVAAIALIAMLLTGANDNNKPAMVFIFVFAVAFVVTCASGLYLLFVHRINH